MNLLILGAAGGTGVALVGQALQRGHMVSAFVRSPGKIVTRGELLSVIQGDPCDATQMEAALRGQDAVWSALGSSGLGPMFAGSLPFQVLCCFQIKDY